MRYIFDGAFGTLYHSRTGRNADYAAVHEPEKTAAIHREYIDAGANAIKTATFGVNFVSMPHRAGEIIAAACKIAEKAASEAQREVAVFADIGMCDCDDPAAAYIAVADVFMMQGATRFLLETLTESAGVAEAVRHIKTSLPTCEVAVSFAVGQDGYTSRGEYYLSLLEFAHEAGADIVGLNCVCGPSHMLSLLHAVDCRKYNVSVMPNAGYPSLIGGRTVYDDAPDYFASRLYEMCRCGVYCAGGCCGTTPAHIKAFADKYKSSPPKVVFAPPSPPVKSVRADEGVFSLQRKVIAVELEAPQNTDTSWLDGAVAEMKAAGADIITVPDSPLARVRADSVMTSARIMRGNAVNVLPHLSCRDKNQIALKGQLIAASLEGIRNILIITGDSASRSGAAGVKDVFGFDATHFIAYINSLNSDIFANTPFYIGAALNTSALNFTAELERAVKKKAAGARAFFTQPVYTELQTDNLRRAREILDGCRLMAGIMPPAGYKNALFLQSEVAGIDIPPELIEKLRTADAMKAKEICVEYACRIADDCRDICDGYYLMVPRRRTDLVLDIIAHIKNM